MEPTNTPTPGWGWSTPTPMSLPTVDPALVVDIGEPNEFFVDMAEYSVQNYQLVNKDGAIDGVMWILIVGIVMLGIRNIYKKVQSL